MRTWQRNGLGWDSFESRTELRIFYGPITGVAYRDEVLAPIVQPFIQNDPRVMTLQYDNARAHTARDSLENLNTNYIKVMPWPSLSPELAPIEQFGRRVSYRPVQTKTA